MALRRLPLRDPRTVARDIPGVLDVLFPRLTGGLVSSLNRRMFSYFGIVPIANDIVEMSQLQRAMLFELAMARTELKLDGDKEPSWDDCLRVAIERQRQHYDAKIPVQLQQCDRDVASHAADNLLSILTILHYQYPDSQLQKGPIIPGLGWIASGVGDFSLGLLLIEVKHTDRNFVAADFRQILMYWLLKYAASLGTNEAVWTDCLLLNPRRNSALRVNFDYLSQSASSSSSRIELFEILRAVVGYDFELQ